MTELTFKDDLRTELDAINNKSNTTEEILEHIKQDTTQKEKRTGIAGSFNKLFKINDENILRICYANYCKSNNANAFEIEKIGLQNQDNFYKIIKNLSLRNLFPQVKKVGIFSHNDISQRVWSIQENGGDKDLNKYNKTNMSNIDRAKILIQIFMACLVMSELGYQHLDLKSDNIRVNTKTNNIKIIDFGFFQNCHDNCESSNGTDGFMNMQDGCGKKNRQNSDFHAFAAIAWEMTFRSKSNTEIGKNDTWSVIAQQWKGVNNMTPGGRYNRNTEPLLIKKLIAGIGKKLPDDKLCEKLFEKIKEHTKKPLAKLILHVYDMKDMEYTKKGGGLFNKTTLEEEMPLEKMPEEEEMPLKEIPVEEMPEEEMPEEEMPSQENLESRIKELDNEKFKTLFNFEKGVLIKLLNDNFRSAIDTEDIARHEAKFRLSSQIIIHKPEESGKTEELEKQAAEYNEGTKIDGGKKKTRKKNKKTKKRKNKKSKRRKTKRRKSKKL